MEPAQKLNRRLKLNITNDILKYFPINIKKELEKCVTQENINKIEEIRIRANKSIFIKQNNSEIVIQYQTSTEEILEILQHICENSIYSYQNQICNGYVTIKGGHRVGISGSAALKEGKITNINYIYSLNFRITKQIFGCSTKIWQHILNLQGNSVNNTLIVSKPRSWKNHYIKRFGKKHK